MSNKFQKVKNGINFDPQTVAPPSLEDGDVYHDTTLGLMARTAGVVSAIKTTSLSILTGITGLATGIATFLSNPTSANLASAVTDETGTGSLVFGTGPALSAPIFSNSTVFTEIATPANPSAGTRRFYVKADGYFYSLNSSGVEVRVGDGDMTLAGVQTVTGAKTFGAAGNVGKLILAGNTSGFSILNAAAVAGATTFTLPVTTGTLIGTGDTGTVTNAMLTSVATATFKGRTTAGTGSPEDLTATQATALLNVFTTSLKGLAPASGGGTTNFLRADGTWASVSSNTTLQNAYDNDVDGGDATITTNATDGSVVIAGTRALKVTAVQGFDVNPSGNSGVPAINVTNNRSTGVGIRVSCGDVFNTDEGISIDYQSTGNALRIDCVNQSVTVSSSGSVFTNTSANPALIVRNSSTGPAIRLMDPNFLGSVNIKVPTLSASYTLTLPVDDGTTGQTLTTDGSGVLSWASVVAGPASSVDNTLARYDGITGKLIQGSGVTVDDSNNISGIGVLVHGANGQQIGPSTSDFYEVQYIHSVTLTASQTSTVASAFTFAHASFEGVKIEYKIKEATTNRVRVGFLQIATNGTATSLTDTFTETDDCGVTWDLNINGANIEVRYTTTANAKNMRSVVKRIKT